ncbi:MAG: TlpA family protein disulfide reductase, partial [Candidatus Omnitrophota bacterium]
HGRLFFKRVYPAHTMKKILIIALCFSFCASSLAQEEVFYTLEGNILSYKDIASSPKAILLLWATWCTYCRKEMRELSDNCELYDDIDFFYVNLGETEVVVKRFSDALDLRECIWQRILLDYHSAITGRFFVIGIPIYIFLKEGKPIHSSYSIDRELIEKVFGDEQ